MKKFEITVHTLKSAGNFTNKYEPLHAIYAGHIYFVNQQKLEIILSLMRLLLEYNEYLIQFQTNDITIWLKNKNMLKTELLEEISYYKSKYICENVLLNLYQFFPYEIYKNYKICYQKYLCTILKNNLKNIIIFDYLLENQEKFNNYLEILLNNKDKIKDFDELKCNILAELNITLINEFSVLNNSNFKLNNNTSMEKLLTVTEIISADEKFCHTCIKPCTTFCFEAEIPEISEFNQIIEKYLQVSEFLNKKRIKYEMAKMTEMVYSNIKEHTYILKKNSNITDKANFSFLNFYQILFYALNDENKVKIDNITTGKNKLLADKIMYFQKNKTGKTDLVNYATISIK